MLPQAARPLATRRSLRAWQRRVTQAARRPRPSLLAARLPAGQRWAQPSAEHLAQLMQHVVGHRAEAAARGRAARRRMLERYSPEAVAAAAARELRRIDALLDARDASRR